MITRKQFLAWVTPPDEHMNTMFMTTHILPELYPRGLSDEEIPEALARELGISVDEATRRLVAVREWIESRNLGEGLEELAPKP